MKVFVYGTLKKGFHANYMMQPGLLINSNLSIKGLKMYSNGSYPMAVKGTDKDKVTGELWDIPDNNLVHLDRYEGHPTLFKRTYLENLDVYLYIFQRQVDFYKEVKDGVF